MAAPRKRRPRTFGGLGGIPGGRPLNETDLFEVAINRAIGTRVKASYSDAYDLWGALANVRWTHKNGDDACYTFRAAGDLVAAVRGDGGDYMDFYCSSGPGVVPLWISTAMAKAGWKGEAMGFHEQEQADDVG